jgi:Zn-dependent peptidase ImmA (M78 family)
LAQARLNLPLMPEQKLHELLHEQSIDAFDEVALRHVANLFGVSTQALTIRLAPLGLISYRSGPTYDSKYSYAPLAEIR